MAGEWRESTVANEVDVLLGFAFKSAEFATKPPGHRLVRGDNIKRSTLEWGDKTRYWRNLTPDLERYSLRAGDVVVGMDGSRVGENFARIASEDLPALLVQRVACLRARENLDQGFLRYLICNPEFTAYVKAVHTGTSIPHISGGQIGNYPIWVPPIDEQRTIAHILGTLDDKIELNRRMNETLEAMARALFKSWFVDFDPVRAKAEGGDPGLPKHIADLFPDRFVDSELGEIPEGWGVECFGDVVDQLRDNENPLVAPDVMFRHFSIPAFDEGQWPKAELGDSIKSQKSRVPPGVVLLSKLNPEIERVWLVDVEPDDRAVCSTEFLVLRPRPPCGRSYVYCLARSPVFRRELVGLVTGTSKSHQRAQAGSILGLTVVRPPDPLLKLFERATRSLLDRTLECRRESRTLADLRDTLLPKMISGELSVNAGERLLTEAS